MYIKKYCYHKSALISSKSTTEIKKNRKRYEDISIANLEK